MARKLGCAVVTVVFAAVGFAVVGCGTTASGNPGQEAKDSDLATCDGDCVQPPVLRDDMEAHLKEHQERILARDDYLDDLPPPATSILFDPLIDDEVRGGPPVVDAVGEPFDGEVDWHYVDFDDVTTTGVGAPPEVRGREVVGAHCFFARKPNHKTTIFALLATRRGASDSLYLAGPRHPLYSLDTRPISQVRPGAIRLADEGLRCAFRHDQNLMGALVIPIESAATSGATDYAVVAVGPEEEATLTDKTARVVRSLGLWIEEVNTELEIPVYEYGEPWTDFIGVYGDLYAAMEAAEDAIYPGRFRLRPEFIYATLGRQAYFSTGKEEFCPKYVECRTPTRYIDIREFTAFSPEFMASISKLYASENEEAPSEEEADEEDGADTDDSDDRD